MKKRVGEVGFVLGYGESGAEQRQSSSGRIARFEVIPGVLFQIFRTVER